MPTPVHKSLPATAKLPNTAGPLAIWWTFKLYCLLMIAFLGVQVALGAYMIREGDAAHRRNPKAQEGMVALVGLVVIGVSAPQLVPIVPALLWPRGRVAWWLGMLALIAGYFIAGGWLIAIPMTFLWGNRNVRAWCGVTPSAGPMSPKALG